MRRPSKSCCYDSSMFDANECALDWCPDHENVREYGDLFVDVIAAELPHILMDEYEPDRQYSANFMSVRKTNCAKPQARWAT